MNKLIGRFTDDVASVAILNLFLDHEIPANGALDLQLLEREWRRTGLRHADLVDGLQQVTNAGLARLSHGEEDRCVILTESGYRRCNGLADSPAGLNPASSGISAARGPCCRPWPLAGP